ncbi:hypothetical protein GCM10010228_80560 [Streptomyces massasporeus]|nr:hypothetical protein GCM10010228_80560 [Streptomyces massasporeus]
MTTRRTLGSGPNDAHSIRASQADLLDALPGVRLPDLAQLRERGVLGTNPAMAPPRPPHPRSRPPNERRPAR